MVRNPHNRDTLIDGVIGVGMIAIGIVTGQALGSLALSVAGNLATKLTDQGLERWRSRWFTDHGVLNHDITKLLSQAFDDTIRQLERDWKDLAYYQHLRHKDLEKAQLTLDALRILREEGVRLFQQPDHLVRVAQREQRRLLHEEGPSPFQHLNHLTQTVHAEQQRVLQEKGVDIFQQSDLYAQVVSRVQRDQVLTLLRQDRFRAAEYIKPALNIYLYGHDDELTAFVTKRLVPELILRFLERLKEPNETGTRAWRACQWLWQESLDEAVGQLQQSSNEIVVIVRWLRDWAQQLSSQPVTERNHVGQDFLEDRISLMGIQLHDVQETTTHIEAKVDQIKGHVQFIRQKLSEDDDKYSVPFLAPPLPNHRLVGRNELLNDLKKHLFSGKTLTLSALRGLPGIGKTALAVALAHDPEVQQHFSDGVLWAGLGRAADILTHLDTWGAALGISPTEMEKLIDIKARQQRIQAALGQRKMLLVADDVWKVDDALALKLGGDNCAYLVTTRLPEVAARFTTDGVTLVYELSEDDGLKLLTQLAPEVVQAEPDDARMLVQAVGGLPLALTIMGNYLRVQTHSGQLQRIHRALTLLHRTEERLQLNEPQGGLESHPSLPTGTPLSLKAVIGISDEALEELARQALRALSVFPPKPNTFSEEAALAVAAVSEELLYMLADVGLLESSGSNRYTLHQIIADYAKATLKDEEAYQRMVEFFVTYVTTHEADYDLLTEESSNILTTLQIAFERRMQAALVRGADAFAHFLETHGMYSLAEMHLQRAQEAARSLGDTAGLITALVNLGKIAERHGDHLRAKEYLQEGLTLAQQGGQSRNVAEALRELGIVARGQGQPDQAQRLYEEAEEIFRELDDQGGIARMLRELGNVARDQGQPDKANHLYMEALAVFSRLEDRRNVAETKGGLGVVWQDKGQPEEAQRLYKEAVDAFHQLGDQRSEARILRNQGNLAREQGQIEEARILYQEVLTISRQLGDRSGISRTLRNLGVLARGQGQLEEARRLYDEALNISRQLDDQGGTARTLRNLGVLAHEQGQPEQARDYYHEALDIFRKLRDRGGFARTLRELGIVEREQGRVEEAIRLHNEALDTFDQLKDRGGRARTLKGLGILARQQGQLERARQLLEEAVDISDQLGDQRNLAITLRELGSVARDQGWSEEALHLHQKALKIFDQLGDKRNIADTKRELGILKHDQGQPVEAKGLYDEALVALRQVRDQDGVARTLRNLGSLVRDQGQGEEARRLYQEAVEISSQLGDQGGIARTLRNMGVLAHDQGRIEEARRLYQEALEALRRLGDQGGVARTLRNMSVLAHDQGQVEEARRLCSEALGIFRQLGDRRNVARTVYDLAALAVEQGHPNEALQLLFNAGVGFSVVDPSSTQIVLKMLRDVRTRVGEAVFTVEIENAAASPPEPAYRIDQAIWEGAIWSLAVHALSDVAEGRD
jgi:tetratricopeptide (TPR) repeat protein